VSIVVKAENEKKTIKKFNIGTAQQAHST